MTKPTKAQIGAYLFALKSIADAIRDAGEIPLGTIYAACIGKMDLPCFEGIIRKLEQAGLVSVSGASLVKWTGPN